MVLLLLNFVFMVKIVMYESVYFFVEDFFFFVDVFVVFWDDEFVCLCFKFCIEFGIGSGYIVCFNVLFVCVYGCGDVMCMCVFDINFDVVVVC